jgi:hypothetical protein
MPEFNQQDLQPWRQVVVSFASFGDQQAFAAAIGQKMTPNTRSIWYPPAEIGRYATSGSRRRRPMNPRYPGLHHQQGPLGVAQNGEGARQDRRPVPDRGRAARVRRVRRRARRRPRPRPALLEPRARVDPGAQLGLGALDLRGPRAALDSRRQYRRLLSAEQQSQDAGRERARSSACAEDFVDRYENVAKAGFNYFMFAPRKAKVPPLYLNTRVYSCILLDNRFYGEFRGAVGITRTRTSRFACSRRAGVRSCSTPFWPRRCKP